MTTTHIHTAYVGLGSNLPSYAGTPAETIRAGESALSEVGEVISRSSLYETAPVGWIDQPSFVNAVVALRTSEAPEALLEKLLAIERRFGRDRGNSVSKGPRTLDLDLLMVDGVIVNTPMLSLPHPAMAERRFVLAPLAEIAPEARHPVLGKTIRELLMALPNTGENKSACVRIMQRYP